MQQSEDRLQQECFIWHWNTYPEERRLLYHNYNNAVNRIKGAQLKGVGVVAGVADLTYIAPGGSVVYIELKLPEGKQSKAQKKFEEAVTKRGARYEIVRSLDQFKEIIGEYHEKIITQVA